MGHARDLGLSQAMLDRLTLKDATIEGIARGLAEVAALPDPVGEVTSMWKRPNGLKVGRMRIPLGVVGIIYESRPNVTADAAALCLKSGNAIILRGGSEAIRSNVAISGILQGVLRAHALPEAAIQVVPMTDREAVYEMLQLDEFIDVIIPRGGEELIRAVVRDSKIPVLKHYKGVCHVFVDRGADQDMAVRISMNAKTQRPASATPWRPSSSMRPLPIRSCRPWRRSSGRPASSSRAARGRGRSCRRRSGHRGGLVPGIPRPDPLGPRRHRP